MRHFIEQNNVQGALAQFAWSECTDIVNVNCASTDCIWLLANHTEWKKQVVQAREKTPNVVLLTYKYDRLEMQTGLVLGIRGYCHILGTHSLFSSVARVLEAGGMWLPNELLKQSTGNIASTLGAKHIYPALSDLTNREKDVLAGILNGQSNKEIAKGLSISERTVKEYVGTLLHKFDVKDRIALLLRIGEFSHLKDVL